MLRKLASTVLSVACVLISGPPAGADSTSPRLAAYYDLKMLLCGGTAYQWRGNDRPRLVAANIKQVGVGQDASYVLTMTGKLWTWHRQPGQKRLLLDQVAWFAAGRTGVFAARPDGSLTYLERPKSWFGEGKIAPPRRVAAKVSAASIGDSANYYVTRDGTLFVKGLAHRGQYGNGKLDASNVFIPVARGVAAVAAHTGHAIHLKRDGRVMGTGGNIYGPLGRHGIGDKATTWGEIFKDAKAVATGSSHTLAIGKDDALWRWGRDIGLEPEKILEGVAAAAADQSASLALRKDNSLWQWKRGERPKRHFACP